MPDGRRREGPKAGIRSCIRELGAAGKLWGELMPKYDPGGYGIDNEGVGKGGG